MVWEWIAAAGFASIGYLAHSAYSQQLAAADAIENAPSCEPGPELHRLLLKTPNKKIPYVSVHGEVQPTSSTTLVCAQDSKPQSCVIREIKRREHKSVYVKSVQEWQSSVGVISSATSEVPFALCSKGGSLKNSVEVKTPLEATGLPLIDMNQRFEPVTNSSAIANISDFISGEKVRGYEEVERALPVGVFLTGIGELSLFNNRMILQRPVSGLPYILSAKSKAELALSERNAANVWKFFYYVCFFIGGGIAFFALFRFWKKWRAERQRRDWEAELARRQIELRREAGSGGQGQGGSTTCVVCLENAADVVVLNCGHLCSCSACASLLTCCPVCRGDIARYVPVFAS